MAILRSMRAADELALVTRVNPAKAAVVLDAFPTVQWHRDAGCLTDGIVPDPSQSVKVGVLAAAQVIEVLRPRWSSLCGFMVWPRRCSSMWGWQVCIVCWRSPPSTSRCTNCLRRDEGALPTVLTGLVPQPVIGVPVSVRPSVRWTCRSRWHARELRTWSHCGEYRQRLWSRDGCPAHSPGTKDSVLRLHEAGVWLGSLWIQLKRGFHPETQGRDRRFSHSDEGLPSEQMNSPMKGSSRHSPFASPKRCGAVFKGARGTVGDPERFRRCRRIWSQSPKFVAVMG